MISRRTFLTGASALALTPLIYRVANYHARRGELLFVKPPTIERRFYLHPEKKGLRLVTDAVEFPLPVVKFNHFEARMGDGSYRLHTQRDHRRLIEEGVFEGEALMIPWVGTGQFDVWLANYAPWSEALVFLEEHGLGPESADRIGKGLTFYEWNDDPAVSGPAVILDDLFAASLLQASFVERGIPVEILRQERGYISFLSGGRTLNAPISGSNYFEPLEEREKWPVLGGRSAEFFRDRRKRFEAMRRHEVWRNAARGAEGELT